MSHFFLFLVLFFGSIANAFEIEAFAGATSTTYDDESEYNNWGASARAKLNFYNDGRGLLVNVNARGNSLFVSEVIVGYGWRTKNPLFFEVGVGGAYSLIFGPGLGGIAGLGYRFGQNLFVNFPVVAYLPYSIFWSPYIGYEF